MAQFVIIEYDCLLCTLADTEVVWERYVSVTVCNIKFQNQTNFSYRMHSINPVFSITTITITTVTTTAVTITNITITSIAYFTFRLFLSGLNIIQSCRLSGMRNLLLHFHSDLWSQTKSNPLLPTGSQGMQIHCIQ